MGSSPERKLTEISVLHRFFLSMFRRLLIFSLPSISSFPRAHDIGMSNIGQLASKPPLVGTTFTPFIRNSFFPDAFSFSTLSPLNYHSASFKHDVQCDARYCTRSHDCDSKSSFVRIIDCLFLLKLDDFCLKLDKQLIVGWLQIRYGWLHR